MQADYLFEVSSEVVNKGKLIRPIFSAEEKTLGKIFVFCGEKLSDFSVGGIFTVIRSKADVTVQEYGKRYFLLGPYNEFQCRQDLEPCEPEQPDIARSLQAMREDHVKV